MTEQTQEAPLPKGEGLNLPPGKIKLPLPIQYDLFGASLFSNREKIPLDPESEIDGMFNYLSRSTFIDKTGFSQASFDQLIDQLKSTKDYGKLARKFDYKSRNWLYATVLYNLQKDRSLGFIDHKKTKLFGDFVENLFASTPEKPTDLFKTLWRSFYEDIKNGSDLDYPPRFTRTVLGAIYQRSVPNRSHLPSDAELLDFAKQPGILNMVYGLEKSFLLKNCFDLVSQLKNKDLTIKVINNETERRIALFIEKERLVLTDITEIPIKDLIEVITLLSVETRRRQFVGKDGRVKRYNETGRWVFMLPQDLVDINNNSLVDIKPAVYQDINIPVGFSFVDENNPKINIVLAGEDIGYIETKPSP